MTNENPLPRIWNNGDAAIGAKVMTLSPSVIELYGSLEFDFAWLDLEQLGSSPLDGPALNKLARAADAAGIEPLVRLPSTDPTLVKKVLGAGIQSLLVPRVESEEELRNVISATQFSYDGAPGHRSAITGRTNTWGASSHPNDDEIIVGTMIETQEATENIDEILSVPDLGFAFIGPADLSIALGHPFKKDHREVQEAVTKIREACLAADIPVGCVANDRHDAEAAIADGYQLLRIGNEMSAARKVLNERKKYINSPR